MSGDTQENQESQMSCGEKLKADNTDVGGWPQGETAETSRSGGKAGSGNT